MLPCFEEPKIKVSIFEVEDIITTSDFLEEDDDSVELPDVGMQ